MLRVYPWFNYSGSTQAMLRVYPWFQAARLVYALIPTLSQTLGTPLLTVHSYIRQPFQTVHFQAHKSEFTAQPAPDAVNAATPKGCFAHLIREMDRVEKFPFPNEVQNRGILPATF